MSKAKHTPGPWRWEFNEKHKNLHLVGGKPMYDLTVIDFERWGMNKATMRLRDTAHDGFNCLYRVHERKDWIAPEHGREHHKSWHQLLTHPDARLIAAAPELLEALKLALQALEAIGDEMTVGERYTNAGQYLIDSLNPARDAIAKATGATT